MSDEKIIKSADRVKNHGEVFTPKRVVDLMLDQPEITAKINDLHATFLEPSAGEGAFLTELLKRKLKVAAKQSKTASAFNTNALVALSTLYGIEYLEDNVEMLVMNMMMTFTQTYSRITVDDFKGRVNDHVLKSAQVIIRANMAQGDTLKGITDTGAPIVFSEWQAVNGQTSKVRRMEYTFESILNQSGPTGTVQHSSQQLDLFAGTEDFDDAKQEDDISLPQYALCKWTDIYKQELE